MRWQSRFGVTCSHLFLPHNTAIVCVPLIITSSTRFTHANEIAPDIFALSRCESILSINLRKIVQFKLSRHTIIRDVLMTKHSFFFQPFLLYHALRSFFFFSVIVVGSTANELAKLSKNHVNCMAIGIKFARTWHICWHKRANAHQL